MDPFVFLTLDLPWSTLQSLYNAEDGEVVEGKYVRLSGHYRIYPYPRNKDDDGLIELSHGYQLVFRNLDDGHLYQANRGMRFVELNSSRHETCFTPPFEKDYGDYYTAYQVDCTYDTYGKLYLATYPN